MGLSVLGFTRAQVGATVCWQAVVTVVAAAIPARVARRMPPAAVLRNE